MYRSHIDIQSTAEVSIKYSLPSMFTSFTEVLSSNHVPSSKIWTAELYAYTDTVLSCYKGSSLVDSLE